MDTPLVCHAHAPGTPNNPIDVLDLTTSEGEIRLTIRREGKLFLNLRWEDDDDGRAQAEAMMQSMAKQFRPPTQEEWQTLPDLKSSVADAKPQDSRLCIQWDIDGRDTDAALDQRNEVLEVIEGLLDEAGLLIEWVGASIGAGTVETTFEVEDFAAAKALVWNGLNSDQKAHNCRIFDETTA